jgi:hypothetical protein
MPVIPIKPNSALINIQYQYKSVLILILNTPSVLILY